MAGTRTSPRRTAGGPSQFAADSGTFRNTIGGKDLKQATKATQVNGLAKRKSEEEAEEEEDWLIISALYNFVSCGEWW